MICIKCNNQLHEATKFCGKCGEKAEAPSEAAPSAEDVPPPQEENNRNAPSQSEQVSHPEVTETKSTLPEVTQTVPVTPEASDQTAATPVKKRKQNFS